MPNVSMSLEDVLVAKSHAQYDTFGSMLLENTRLRGCESPPHGVMVRRQLDKPGQAKSSIFQRTTLADAD